MNPEFAVELVETMMRRSLWRLRDLIVVLVDGWNLVVRSIVLSFGG